MTKSQANIENYVNLLAFRLSIYVIITMFN